MAIRRHILTDIEENGLDPEKAYRRVSSTGSLQSTPQPIQVEEDIVVDQSDDEDEIIDPLPEDVDLQLPNEEEPQEESTDVEKKQKKQKKSKNK